MLLPLEREAVARPLAEARLEDERLLVVLRPFVLRPFEDALVFDLLPGDDLLPELLRLEEPVERLPVEERPEVDAVDFFVLLLREDVDLPFEDEERPEVPLEDWLRAFFIIIGLTMMISDNAYQTL